MIEEENTVHQNTDDNHDHSRSHPAARNLHQASSCQDLNMIVDVCKECLGIDSPAILLNREDSVRLWDMKYLASHDCGLSIALRAVIKDPYCSFSVFRYIASGAHSRNIPISMIMTIVSASEERAVMVRMTRNFSMEPQILASEFNLAKTFDRVDFRQIKEWLRFCRADHASCVPHNRSTLPGLRLIDCRTKELCLAPQSQAYIALSYVWGPQTTSRNEIRDDVASPLPDTIEDAMTVAKEIGIPYLWVDRYCINQEDHKEKHIMVSNMDRVYSEAELTIIASSGPSPFYGLPGVSKPRCPTRWKQLNAGILDFFKHPSFGVDITGPWAKRAWTFQEMLLSRRRLVFTDSQMMFRCCRQTFLESLSLKPFEIIVSGEVVSSVLSIPGRLGCTSEIWGGQRHSPQQVNSAKPTDIYDFIAEYSRRMLSHPEDRLNAIEGIFSAFRNEVVGYAHHFWGIPILDKHWDVQIDPALSFCIGLQWQPTSGISLLDKWPSWSWAARSHGVQYQYPPPASLHDGVSITLVRLDGHREDVAQFIHGQRSYEEYHPWIEFTTWVGPCDGVNAGGRRAYGDRLPRPSDVALYTGTWLGDTECYTFVVAEDIGDGSLRRVRLARHERDVWDPVTGEREGRVWSEAEIIEWDKEIRRHKLSAQDFFEGWERKTVRLV